MKTNDDANIDEKYKDNLFRYIFGRSKENALSLYNAVNGTNYTDAEDLEITTLEDVIYIKMKNDISFIFGNELNLYEHQSTFNPNMPIRGMIYMANLYKKFIHKSGKEYSSTQIKLPTPRYIVFYNGTDKHGDRETLKLSNAFEIPDKSGDFEWTAIMLNINYGHNKEILDKCQLLKEYAYLVDKVNKNNKLMKNKDAIDLAVKDCIKEGVLKGILDAHRAEVYDMLLTEFNSELYEKTIREESLEKGIAQGIAQGISQGISQGILQGIEKGENRLFKLFNALKEKGRVDDFIKASQDETFKEKLFEEFGI